MSNQKATFGLGLEEAKAIVVRPSEENRWLDQFGRPATLGELAQVMRPIVPNGGKLSDKELVALAQVALMHGLDPTIGEIWGIPEYGVFTGIAGWRRKAHEWCLAHQDGYHVHFELLTEQERAQEEIDDGDMAIWAVLERNSDRKARIAEIAEAKEAGLTFEEAVEIVGPLHVFRGLGVLRADEIALFKAGKGAWEPGQHVRVRAERDVIRRAFGVNLPEEGYMIEAIPSTAIEVDEDRPQLTAEERRERAVAAANRLAPRRQGPLGQKPVADNGNDGGDEEGESEDEPEGDDGNGLVARLRDTPRPWSAEDVKAALLHQAEQNRKKGMTGPGTEKQRGLFAGKCDDLLDGLPAKRIEFMEFVFGKTSSKKLDMAQLGALLDWMLTRDEQGEWQFKEHAREEAENCIRQGALDQGQADMFEAEAEPEAEGQASLPGMEQAQGKDHYDERD